MLKKKCSSCLVIKTGYVWSSVYNRNGGVGLKAVKEGLYSKIDKLANESEGKQAKGKSILLCELPPEDVAQIEGGVSHLKSSYQDNPSQMCLAACALVDFKCSQVDSEDKSLHVSCLGYFLG